MNKIEVRARFAQLATQHENEIELDRAALLIAAEEYPTLEIDAYIRRLDDFANQARTAVASAAHRPQVQALSEFLASELKFDGNRDKYFEARNSFFNEVIDRRTGIPITLSVLYLEIARRIGIRLSGVGAPGHFLVKSMEDDQEIFIDPFHAGRLLTAEQCRELIEELYAGRLKFRSEFLASVTKRQILTRMLQNLKGIYSGLRDHSKTLAAIERLLILNPGSPMEIRDRGGVYQAMGRYADSIADLEEYLRRRPEADDIGQVKEMIKQARQRQARNN